MTQVVNDQMIDELRASFFHKRRELWCLANNDVRPNDDRRGLGVRWITPQGDASTFTSHFRTGDVAGAGELASYSWINDGTFGGAPATTLTYSYSGEYMATLGDNAATRHFLARSITNAAANWQNVSIWGRFSAFRAAGGHGLRIDTGADGTAGEAYAEIYIAGSAAGGSSISFRSRVNGGAISTVTFSFLLPHTQMVTLRLLMAYVNPVYTAHGYIIGESGVAWEVGTQVVTAYVPQAGQVGIINNSDALGRVNGSCDWFRCDFT